MTTVELKNILINKITEIEDKSFLITINSIIEANSTFKIYQTNSDQKKKIQQGRDQISKGEFYTNEQVQQEIDQWLKGK